jgi:hypothetical protein
VDRDDRVRLGIGIAVGALLAILFALVASDGGDDDPLLQSATSDAATPVIESTSTEIPASTDAAPASTDPEPALAEPEPAATAPEPSGPCLDEESARPMPASAEQLSDAVVDLDRDGTAETLRIYRDVELSHWFVRVELANGIAFETVMDGNAGRVVKVVTIASRPMVLAQTADIDGRPGYNVFYFADCRLGTGRDAVGDQLIASVGERWVGGDLVAVDGLRCEADGYTQTRSRPAESGPYEWAVSSLTYAWDSAVGFVPGMEISIAFCCNRPADDALILGTGALAC